MLHHIGVLCICAVCNPMLTNDMNIPLYKMDTYSTSVKTNITNQSPRHSNNKNKMIHIKLIPTNTQYFFIDFVVFAYTSSKFPCDISERIYKQPVDFQQL